MKLHGDARTCPHSRLLMVRRVEEEGWTLMRAAEAAGVSVRTVSKWLACWRADGEQGLSDRSSAPGSIPHRTPERRVGMIVTLRRLGMTAAEIAECLSMPASTVSAVLTRIGLGRLSRLERPEAPNRYERRRAGELLQIDVKKLVRIAGAGHRVTGSRRGQAQGIGWEFVHIAIDDAARIAYVEVLDDEEGHDRGRLPATSRCPFRYLRSTLSPAGRSESATCAPGPTDHKRTAGPSASSARSLAAGPTVRSTEAQPSGHERSPAGSASTIAPDHTAPSAANRHSRDSRPS